MLIEELTRAIKDLEYYENEKVAGELLSTSTVDIAIKCIKQELARMEKQGMLIEKAKKILRGTYDYSNDVGYNESPNAFKYAYESLRFNEALEMAIQALEQEPKTSQFAEWVAEEIFDENWEYNKDAFAELACRQLAKLGIVRAKGNEWELVVPQKNCDTCKHKEESWDSEHCDGCCSNYSGFDPQESEEV